MTNITLKAGLSLLALLGAGLAPAATAEEAAQLGKTLTPWGAEKAANKDGSIPEYTGGLSTPPANYDPKRPGWLPDPFPNDKPQVTITAANMAPYADKLSPGLQAMLKRYNTFAIDLYPTRRSAAYPKPLLDASIKNATRCKLIGVDGLDTTQGCALGFPFPVPKSGYEVLKNMQSRYYGGAFQATFKTFYVKPNGEVVVTGLARQHFQNGFHLEAQPKLGATVRTEYFGPARLVGDNSLSMDFLADYERKAYSYTAASRRVRMAPDLAADTPIAQLGGVLVYDDVGGFSGKSDRFEWKLVGKQEMIVPANTYNLDFAPKGYGCTAEEGKYLPNHIKPKCMRFELRRVWHIQGLLKEGKRHVYSKRDIYIDEDAWYGGMAETYDLNGKIWRVAFQATAPNYSVLAPSNDSGLIHDLVSGVYFHNEPLDGFVIGKGLPAEYLNPETLTTGVLK